MISPGHKRALPIHQDNLIPLYLIVMKTTPSIATYDIATLADWARIAPLLCEQAKGIYIWCLKGNLGAGKTTLIKALCHHLGAKTPVTSPTYGLIHEYLTTHAYKIYHMDFYRLKRAEEALAIGFESYLTGEDYLFIEWPTIIESLLPSGRFDIEITMDNPPKRKVIAQCYS